MDDYTRKNQLGSMLGNIKYVLDQALPTFPLLPEIYISKARILFKFHSDAEAVDVLFKLTQMKPSYALAYAQLGDYYQRVGDKSNAIKYYEQGLINTDKRNADFFIFKIKKMGYPSIYGNATIMKWNQRSQPPSARLPKLGLIIRATTPSFWRGFRMMLPALTTLTGSAGKTDLHAHRATASKAGA